MSMIVYSYFADENNLAVTGLTPTIDIYDQTIDSMIVDGLNMTETGHDGWYEYDFSALYDETHVYTGNSDGGDTLDNYDRYQEVVIPPEDSRSPSVDFG